MTRVADILKEEHRKIRKAIRSLDILCDRLESGAEVEEGQVKGVLSFITAYGDDFHHTKEEEVFLPFIENAGMPESLQNLEMLLGDHLLQRGYLEAMEDALSRIGLSSSDGRKKFLVQARNLIGLLSEHIFKEDLLFFEIAERFLTEEHKKKLITLFGQYDKGFSKWKQLKRIEGEFEAITRDLQIDDDEIDVFADDASPQEGFP